MGTLTKFELNEYIKKYELTDFIETGTYLGDGLNYAKNFKFKNLYSIELIEQYYNHCYTKFKEYNNIKLYNGKSTDMLSLIFTENRVGNTLFWLDAHLPHFYDSKYNTNYSENKNVLIPLEEEINIICNSKNTISDVIIIDDLRLYEIGNFESGNWLDVINCGYNNIDFIFKNLDKTHNIKRMYENEGYLICLPK